MNSFTPKYHSSNRI